MTYGNDRMSLFRPEAISLDIIIIIIIIIIFCAAAQCGLWPPRLRGFLNTHNDATQSVGLLWTSDQLVAETSTWQHKTHNRQTSMPPLGFEPTIAAGERP
jgi:hypothetical protein